MSLISAATTAAHVAATWVRSGDEAGTHADVTGEDVGLAVDRGPEGEPSDGLDCPIYGQNDEDFLEAFSFWVEGVLQTGFAILGIVGNIVASLIISRREMRNSFNLMLVSLACFDSTYLFGSILESFRKDFDLQSDTHVVLFPYLLYPLNQMAISASIFMTVAIAWERYIAVHYPLDYNQAMNDSNAIRKRLVKYVGPVLALAFIFNIVKFFEAKVVYAQVAATASDAAKASADPAVGSFSSSDGVDLLDVNSIRYVPELHVAELRTHPAYSAYHNWSRLIVLGIVPFVLLVFFNTKIYKDIRERRKRRLRIFRPQESRVVPGYLTAPTCRGMTTLGQHSSGLSLEPGQIQRGIVKAAAPMGATSGVAGQADAEPVGGSTDPRSSCAARAFSAGVTLQFGDSGQIDRSKVGPARRRTWNSGSVLGAPAGSFIRMQFMDHIRTCDSQAVANGLAMESNLGKPLREKTFTEWRRAFGGSWRGQRSIQDPSLDPSKDNLGRAPEKVSGSDLDVNGHERSMEEAAVGSQSTTIESTPEAGGSMVYPLRPQLELGLRAAAAPVADTDGPVRPPVAGSADSSRPTAAAENPQDPVAPELKEEHRVDPDEGKEVVETTDSLAKSRSRRLTTLRIRRVQSSNERRRHFEDNLAAIFMGFVMVFLVCHMPRLLLNIHELATIKEAMLCSEKGEKAFSLWSLVMISVSHFLLTVNSSLNILVYCMMSSKFRQECRNIFIRPLMACWTKCSDWIKAWPPIICERLGGPFFERGSNRAQQQEQTLFKLREQSREPDNPATTGLAPAPHGTTGLGRRVFGRQVTTTTTV